MKQFLDLGQQPIANRFLSYADDPDDEIFYHLVLCFCPDCYTVQLGTCPKSIDVFNRNYPFFTSTSNYMKEHLKILAQGIKSMFKPHFIVEIGSNDGTFLENFKDDNHLGIEPSGSVAKESIKKGINTLGYFFDESVADWVISERGQADIIVSTNVFPHISNRITVLKGIKKLLSNGGTWIDEEVYLQDIINKVSYDQFYNEHVFYATLTSYKKMFDMFGLKIINYQFIGVHGGSIRFYITHQIDNNMPLSTEFSWIDEEICSEDLFDFIRLKRFSEKVEESRYKLLSKLGLLKGKGEEIVGYGATAKSSTILNYCGINSNVISRIYDTTPCKHNTLSPGMHIPIVSYERFHADNPKNVVLFAWNHATEIFEKEKGRDINWILPI